MDYHFHFQILLNLTSSYKTIKYAAEFKVWRLLSVFDRHLNMFEIDYYLLAFCKLLRCEINTRQIGQFY